MFHTIENIVNAPSRVLLARSRSSQDNPEGIPTLFGLVFGDLHLQFVTATALPPDIGTPTLSRTPCHADPRSHLRDKPSLQGFGARSVRRRVPTGRRCQRRLKFPH